MELCTRWPFTVGRSSTWMWWSPTTRRGFETGLGMCNLYQILRTVHWKHTEAHLRTSTPSSIGSSKTIGSGGGTICWLLKFGATRHNLSFWLHQTTCLGSSKCLIPLSPIRPSRIITWSPQPSQTTSYLSVIGERWTRRCDGWTSRWRCVRLSRRGQSCVTSSTFFRGGV
ncbi:hypothetical protein Scep_016578 [Stephania cephalantha]|uniref:Uncharacterized protein n=1 Tax=Stephania cephalantha TaxID=152367 RepID=A0AAP0INR7_9MAGN